MMVSDDMEELDEITKADLNLEPVKDVIFSVTREEELEGWYDPEKERRLVENTLKINAYKEGKAEGHKEGRKEGLEEGLQQGIEQEKLSTIKKMLEKNIDIDTICDITGFSKSKINEIKDTL